MSIEERDHVLHDWAFWGRPEQHVPPGDWFIWLICCGRFWGKTRTGAEALKWAVLNGYQRLGIAAATAGDVRDVMVDGESGILSVWPRKARPEYGYKPPHYEPSKRRITFHTGATCILLSADDPEAFRGKQYEFFWADEIITWPDPITAWSNIALGLRLPGRQARAVFTTTPKKRTLANKLIGKWRDDPDCVITTGFSSANRSNVDKKAYSYLTRTLSGTSVGREELHGEWLPDDGNGMWSEKIIEDTRVESHPELRRIIVAIDPSSNQGSSDACECGMIVAGIGYDGHCYILEDLSDSLSPKQWATKALKAYEEYKADRIVYETNLAGATVETVFRLLSPNAPLKGVIATKGKAVRAEPVSALYERGMVHHVGLFKELEDQLTTWVPGRKSPDRLDALVWAVTELALGHEPIDGSAFDNFNQNDFRRSFYDDEDDWSKNTRSHY